MKYKLELNLTSKHKYLNFWDSERGNDVICLVKDDSLFLIECDEHGDELPPKEITLSEFIQLVKSAEGKPS